MYVKSPHAEWQTRHPAASSLAGNNRRYGTTGRHRQRVDPASGAPLAMPLAQALARNQIVASGREIDLLRRDGTALPSRTARRLSRWTT